MKQEAIALYRGNVQRTGEYQAVGVPDFHGIAWQFKTGGPVDLTPVVADGIVLVMSNTDRTLYALDVPSGERRWHLQMSDFVDTPPHVADGVVYVGDGSIHALDLHTGQRLWTWSAHDLPSEEALRELHADGDVDGFMLADVYEPKYYVDNGMIEIRGFVAPICYRDRLYVVSESVVMALDLATRQPVWWKSTPGRLSGSSLTIANDQLYFTAVYTQSSDALYNLNSTTGLYTSSLPDRDMVSGLRAFAFRDGILYGINRFYLLDYLIDTDSFFNSETTLDIGETDDSVIFREWNDIRELDATTESDDIRLFVEWPVEPELEDAEGLAVGQDMVYVTTNPEPGKRQGKSAMIAYHRGSGQMIWQRSDLTATRSSVRFPTLAGSVLYLILDGQMCCALDAATGQERWRIPLEAEIVAPPCIADETVFVAAGPSIYALR